MNQRERARRAMRFLRDYCRYIHEVRTRQSLADWGRRFGEEVLRSPVSQVSLVLAVMGITGVVIGLFHLILANPVLPVVVLGSGALIAALLSMFAFYLSSRTVASAGGLSDKLERLLKHLLQGEEKMTRAAIAGFLGSTERETRELVNKAAAQGLLEHSGGTWKVPEAMRPLLRRKFLRKREESRP